MLPILLILAQAPTQLPDTVGSATPALRALLERAAAVNAAPPADFRALTARYESEVGLVKLLPGRIQGASTIEQTAGIFTWVADSGFGQHQEGYRVGLHYLRDVDKREVDFLVTVEGKPWFAVECNNGCWDLLEAESLTPQQAERLVHMAHAACHHWLQVGTGLNHLRAECLLATVYARLGYGDAAERHANRCLELSAEAGESQTAFDRATAHGCAGRALALAGRGADRRRAAAPGNPIPPASLPSPAVETPGPVRIRSAHRRSR